MDNNHGDQCQIETISVKSEDEEQHKKTDSDNTPINEKSDSDAMTILTHLAEGGTVTDGVQHCFSPQPYLHPLPFDCCAANNHWDQVYVPRAPEVLTPGGGGVGQQAYYFYYDYNQQQYYTYPAEVYHHPTYHPSSGAPSSAATNVSLDQPQDESDSNGNSCSIKAYGTYTASGEKIRRPPNAFMIFAKERRRELLYSSHPVTNKEVSKQLGIEWRALPDETKAHYQRLSEEMRHEHQLKYPGYYYSPVEARKRKEEKRQKKANERSTRSRPD